MGTYTGFILCNKRKLHLATLLAIILLAQANETDETTENPANTENCVITIPQTTSYPLSPVPSEPDTPATQTTTESPTTQTTGQSSTTTGAEKRPTRSASIFLRIMKEYTSDYDNSSSEAYKSLTAVLAHELAVILRTVEPQNFKNVVIVGLKRGSIIINSTAEFYYPNNQSEIDSFNSNLEHSLNTTFNNPDSLKDLSEAVQANISVIDIIWEPLETNETHGTTENPANTENCVITIPQTTLYPLSPVTSEPDTPATQTTTESPTTQTTGQSSTTTGAEKRPTRSASIFLRIMKEYTPDYDNSSSEAYKSLTAILAHELAVILRTVEPQNFKNVVIVGLKRGSIIVNSTAEFFYPNNQSEIDSFNSNLEHSLNTTFNNPDSLKDLSEAVQANISVIDIIWEPLVITITSEPDTPAPQITTESPTTRTTGQSSKTTAAGKQSTRSASIFLRIMKEYTPDYDNSSSEAYKSLTATLAHELAVILRTVEPQNFKNVVIVGLKRGSIIVNSTAEFFYPNNQSEIGSFNQKLENSLNTTFNNPDYLKNLSKAVQANISVIDIIWEPLEITNTVIPMTSLESTQQSLVCNGSPCSLNMSSGVCECNCSVYTYGDSCQWAHNVTAVKFAEPRPTRNATVIIKAFPGWDLDPAVSEVTRELSAIFQSADPQDFRDIDIVKRPDGSIIITAHYNYPNNQTQMDYLNNKLESRLVQLVLNLFTLMNLSEPLHANVLLNMSSPEITSITELKPFLSCVLDFANFTMMIQEGSWICEGPCKTDPGYCNHHGDCLNGRTGPQCQCYENNLEEYHGRQCEIYSRTPGFYAALFGTLAGAIIILILVVFFICFWQRRRNQWTYLSRAETKLAEAKP